MSLNLDGYVMTDIDLDIAGTMMKVVGFGTNDECGAVYEGEDAEGNLYEIDLNGKVVTVNGEAQ